MEKSTIENVAISQSEINLVKNKVRVGNKVKILDNRRMHSNGIGFGAVITTKISAKYPRIVTLENGSSITYVQLAMYYRNGKKGYIK